jgi:hypothetical protein
MSTIRRTNDEWRVLIAEQRTSGLTQEDWCAANNININTMKDRGYRLKRMDKEPSQKPQRKETKIAPIGWLEVKTEKLPKQTTDINIRYGGFTVTVTAGDDFALLTEALRAVSRACC